MRLENWVDSLGDVVRLHQEQVFCWGISDCLRFPLACVTAITGEKFIEVLGTYDSKKTAYRRLKDFGFNDVADAFSVHFTEISTSHMTTGDLATVGRSGAVCVGSQIAVKEQNGLAFISRSFANRAFRVG